MTAPATQQNNHRIRPSTILALAAAGMILFCLGAVSGHHIHRIEKVFKKLKSVYASNGQSVPSPSLSGRQLFPPDDTWNTDISREPVDPNSDALIASVG